MKIALPTEAGQINQHFGRSREFTVVEVDSGQIVSQKKISAETLQHNHEGLAGLMKGENVDVVIVGGIGAKALQALKENGLNVISGGSGTVEDVVQSYVRGELAARTEACSHHHGEHPHGRGCSH